MTLGASVALLGAGILGIEADVGHTPKFFEGDDPLGLSSRAGSRPSAATCCSPRRWRSPANRCGHTWSGGLGLMQARSSNAASLFPLEEDRLGLSVGGGAIGFVSERTGLRFDVRHIKAISGPDGPFPRDGVSRLSFWRATAGLTIRY